MKDNFEAVASFVRDDAKRVYDVLIVGGGPAGMSAGIYAVRRGKRVAIVEKMALGGQMNAIARLENFPSQFGVDGLSLSQEMAKQVKNLGVEIVRDDVVGVDFSSDMKKLAGKKGDYFAKSVVIATGMSYVELGIGENEFLGRGVSYCAVCDANFYRGKEVCVASRNGSGLRDALVLAEVCAGVTVLDSGNLRVYASANKNEKIRIISGAEIVKVNGVDTVQSVTANVDGESREIETSALFVALGKKPQTKIFGDLKVDAGGFVVTDENMRTSIGGVFAVGDVRSGVMKQIVTACGDGAIAGSLA